VFLDRRILGERVDPDLVGTRPRKDHVSVASPSAFGLSDLISPSLQDIGTGPDPFAGDLYFLEDDFP
jgi:hypothetical protein